MLAAIYVEFLKLKRSLALLLCVGAPSCVGAFAGMFLLVNDKPRSWAEFLQEGVAVWAYFMLPLTITALGILLAQMEHVPKMWNHLLVLPVARGKLFIAKTFVMITLLVMMQVLIYAMLFLTGTAGEILLPGVQLTGSFPVYRLGIVIAAMTAGACLLTVVQLWAALRFKSFVPPLMVGIVGTFIALVVTASREGIYAPWLLQIYALSWPDAQAKEAIAIATLGGIVAAIIMTFDLSRRETH